MQLSRTKGSVPNHLGRRPPTGVEGVRLRLRLIVPDDAAYVYGLRSDATYNRYLSAVNGTVDDQRRWIDAYKTREHEKREAYYVIERKDGHRCGLVRLYDIGPESFTWGSWILDANKPPKAALESAFLSFGVGFVNFGCSTACVDVRIDNFRAIAIYRRLGMIELRRTERDIYFAFSRQQFETDLDEHRSKLAEDCSKSPVAI